MLGGYVIMSVLNRKLVVKAASVFSLIFLVGCTNTQKSSMNNESRKIKTDINNMSNKSYINKTNQKQQKNAAQNAVLGDIRTLSAQGKIINSEYPVKDANISTVEKKWGKADKSAWISSAKGLYSTYSKRNVIFGSNKGGQIFEARSLDPKLRKISLSMVKSIYGTSQHDVKAGGEETIGYTIGKDYKLLFVFPEPTKNTPDPLMRSYSVLYPAGTVNSMANDPGRQW